MTPRLPPPDSDLIERREILDAAGLGRTLRRMALELAERIPQEGRPLYLVSSRVNISDEDAAAAAVPDQGAAASPSPTVPRHRPL